MPVFIIEHLEPKVWKWCFLEYSHISGLVSKKNVWFTNVKSSALSALGKVIKKSAVDLGLRNVCVLDPEAKQVLMPGEAKRFDFFVFGGILGDNPPRERTGPELTSKMKNVQVRNLGHEQMSTDTAVFVVKQILNGKKLGDLKFQDGIEIETGDGESVILPYKYALVKDKPWVSEELIEYIKKKKGF